jgi:hypothetical protein
MSNFRKGHTGTAMSFQRKLTRLKYGGFDEDEDRASSDWLKRHGWLGTTEWIQDKGSVRSLRAKTRTGDSGRKGAKNARMRLGGQKPGEEPVTAKPVR